MIFWLSLVGLTALAVAFAVVPFLRTGAAQGSARRDATLKALYRQRLAELNEESAAGIVDPENLEEMEEELGGVLLREFQDDDADVATGRRGWGWLAIAVAVPVVAIITYQSVGDPDARLLVGGTEVMQLDPNEDAVELDRWREVLTNRVADRPDDGQSWYLLGHIYLKDTSFQRAAEAFSMAHAAFGDDVSIDIYWLQSRYLAADGLLDDASRAIAERILARQADQPMVLEILAIDAYRSGDYRQAVGLLNRALSVPQGPLQQAALMAGMKQARAMLGDLPPSIDVALSSSEAPPREATLFVIARPVGGGMPFAVVRRPASPLPESIRLDDAVSMNPALPLSAAVEFEVVARISLAGTAMANPGDWEWRSAPLTVAELESATVLDAELAPP